MLDATIVTTPVTPPATGWKEPPAAPRIGPYEIVRRLGTGGMAEIFQARRETTAGSIIIKRILPQFADHADAVLAFIQEAKLLAMLCHPNVVRLCDFGEHEGRHFIVLEYLDGASLASIMGRARKAQKALPFGFVAYVAREIARGLTAVHALRDAAGKPMNIIHRDVTPSNVMTTSAGEVKLLDFGIAKPAGQRRTRLGQVKGKSGYLAPEQIVGGTVDRRVDIFALGVITYEMLTLEPLFYGEGGDWATVRRTLEKPIVAPSRARREIPAVLDAVVLRALRREPKRRYRTAEAMAEDFDEAFRLSGFSRRDITQVLADISQLP